jgi:hypothetical protein
MGDVEVRRAAASFRAGGLDFPAGSYVIPMRQPFAAFANTMLEIQEYPDLREYPGGPPLRPYDVTAHTLGYLMDFEAVAIDGSIDTPLSEPISVPDFAFTLPPHLTGADAPRIGLYKSWNEPMPEGWQRWVFDKHAMPYDTLHDADIQNGALQAYDVLVFQSQSANSIREGRPAGSVPPAYAGGLGPAGVEAVRRFVEGGGRLVAIEDATDFAQELFNLNLTDVTDGLSSTDFYIPGAILRVELEPSSLAEGLRDEVAAWYWRSSKAFDVRDQRARVIARYGTGDPLLSGWVLGGDRIAGRPAIVEAEVGRGSVVLFGFQPNYRAQSVATWPLLFNALTK